MGEVNNIEITKRDDSERKRCPFRRVHRIKEVKKYNFMRGYFIYTKASQAVRFNISERNSEFEWLTALNNAFR